MINVNESREAYINIQTKNIVRYNNWYMKKSKYNGITCLNIKGNLPLRLNIIYKRQRIVL